MKRSVGLVSCIGLACAAIAQQSGLPDLNAARCAIASLEGIAKSEQECDDESERTRLANELAKGLDHPEWLVREKCVRLLAKARQTSTATEHLFAGAQQLPTAIKSAFGKLVPPVTPPAPKTDSGKTLPSADLMLRILLNSPPQKAGAWMVFFAYRNVFAAMPAESGRVGLTILAHGCSYLDRDLLFGPLFDVIDEASLRRLVEYRTAFAGATEAAADELTRSRALKAEAERSGAAGDKGSGEPKRLHAVIQRAAEQQQIRSKVQADFEAMLAAAAKRHGLPPSPSGRAGEPEWSAWLQSALRAVATGPR